MVYEITIKINTDDISELEDIFNRYDIDFKVNDVYESEAV